MLRRQANAGLLLLVFMLASPLVGALCDAACAGGSEPGMHHASATPAPASPAKLANAHHEQPAQLATLAAVTDLLGSSSRCVVPRLDGVATKSSNPSADLYALADSSGAKLASATFDPGTGRQTSAPDTSPPTSTPLRI